MNMRRVEITLIHWGGRRQREKKPSAKLKPNACRWHFWSNDSFNCIFRIHSHSSSNEPEPKADGLPTLCSQCCRREVNRFFEICTNNFCDWQATHPTFCENSRIECWTFSYFHAIFLCSRCRSIEGGRKLFLDFCPLAGSSESHNFNAKMIVRFEEEDEIIWCHTSNRTAEDFNK